MASVQRFGRNVRRARLERGLTQQQVADRSGLVVAEVSRVERGVREVRLRTLLNLAGALDAPPSELPDGLSV
jgi:transcriptional regulator with XRE-family HTH domain